MRELWGRFRGEVWISDEGCAREGLARGRGGGGDAVMTGYCNISKRMQRWDGISEIRLEVQRVVILKDGLGR